MKRRHFIQGLGTTLIYLPICDFMLNSNGTAFAQSGGALPTRMLVMVNGISLIRNIYGDTPGPKPAHYTTHVPSQIGANYDLKAALAPLGVHQGLQDYVSVVSNLKIPFANSGPIPAGGMRGGVSGSFHAQPSKLQLTGTAAGNATSGDHLLRAELDPNQAFTHMNYCVQAGNYQGKDDASRGWAQFDNGRGLPPVRSPRAIFTQLFGGGLPTNENEVRQQKLALSRRKSVLDLINQADVRKVAGKSKQAKFAIEEYFTSIRTIERTLASQIVRLDEGVPVSCASPMDPGEMIVNNPAEYNNEKLRAMIINEMIAMSISCNISRFGTYRVTDEQSNLRIKEFVGDIAGDSNYHKATHHRANGTEWLTKMYAWHTEIFADLANRLKNIPEGSGNALDNSSIVLLTEGGGGEDVENGRKQQPHSTENMMTLIAGKSGGLRGGIHVDGSERHPSKVILSAMRAAGSKKDSIGEIEGVIPELFG